MIKPCSVGIPRQGFEILAMMGDARYIYCATNKYVVNHIYPSPYLSSRQPDTLLSSCAWKGAACQKTTICSKEIQATLTTCDLAQGSYVVRHQSTDRLGSGDNEYLYLLHRQDKVRDSLGRKWRTVAEIKGSIYE